MKVPKRKTSKVLDKEWVEALAASDKGSYFGQDKLLEMDGLHEQQDKAVPGLVPAMFYLICNAEVKGGREIPSVKSVKQT